MSIAKRTITFKRMNYVIQDYTFILDQITRLSYSQHILNKRKKISKVMKTLKMFSCNSKSEYFDAIMKANNLHYSYSEIKNVDRFLKLNSSVDIMIENYDFVREEIKELDLEYSIDKRLTYLELRYFLFKLSKYILDYAGKRVLARNYLMKFKDRYNKNTKRTLNTHKIGHMLQVFEKYEYLYLSSDHRSFWIGKNHPLFYADCVSEKNRQYVLTAPDTKEFKLNMKDVKSLLVNISQEKELAKDELMEKEHENRKLKKEVEDLKEALAALGLKRGFTSHDTIANQPDSNELASTLDKIKETTMRRANE